MPSLSEIFRRHETILRYCFEAIVHAPFIERLSYSISTLTGGIIKLTFDKLYHKRKPLIALVVIDYKETVGIII